MPRLTPDKKRHTKMIGVWLEAEERDRFAAFTERQGSTMSQYMRRLIREAMAREKEGRAA